MFGCALVDNVPVNTLPEMTLADTLPPVTTTLLVDISTLLFANFNSADPVNTPLTLYCIDPSTPAAGELPPTPNELVAVAFGELVYIKFAPLNALASVSSVYKLTLPVVLKVLATFRYNVSPLISLLALPSTPKIVIAVPFV